MPSSETFVAEKKRMFYWKKLILDGDIPLDDLYYLIKRRKHYKKIMTMFLGSNNLVSSDFNSEAYLDYRRRVFEQLASEHDKGQDVMNADEILSQPNEQFHDLHSSAYNSRLKGEPTKNLNDTQPTWDDSDLQAETYTFCSTENSTNQWEVIPTNDSCSILMPELTKEASNTVFATQPTFNNPMNWSQFEDRITALSLNSTSKDLFQPAYDANDNFKLRSNPLSPKLKAPHIQEQKLEREAVRCRLAFGGDSDDENDDFANTSDKSWTSPDRTFSANSQSLHICYINESCSSDESDSEIPQTYTKAAPAFSPLNSPSNSCSKQTETPQKSPHSSSSTSRNSLDLTSISENTVQNDSLEKDLVRLKQAKRDELEMETRFQLAQAQQKAKILAKAEKKIERLQRRSSLAQRLVSDTLPEETAHKLKSYSLTKRDCKLMTVGQLQLILNDMHSKKQALNEELVKQLIKRDELQTEQDAKLTDVEDAKTMLDAMGPETTV